MAVLPLNAFKNIAAKLTTSEQILYTVPEGASTIILSANCSNYTSSDVSVTFKIEKLEIVGGNPTYVQYYIVPGINVVANDLLSVAPGRIVLEEGNRLRASAGSNNAVDFVMSINEAANE